MISGSESKAGFETRERKRQEAYFGAQFPDKAGHAGSGYRLRPEHAKLNLAPSIQDAAEEYYKLHGISWHTHRNHGLSSQVCCLNFLMPLAGRRELLARVVAKALGITSPEMLPVETGPGGRDWFVGFEWNGTRDYLNEAAEARPLTRGSQSTSADAIVRFRSGDRIEVLLIEWKYTESYGAPIPDKGDGVTGGNATRTKRYSELAFAPNGPIRNDLGLKLEDFFWEPFYQLFRQQMLAFQMQKARELDADRVRVLHISPAGNSALKKVTSPALRRFGHNPFEVFRSLLVRQDDFVHRSTEELFGPLIAELGEGDNWAAYLTRRYAFLGDVARPPA